MVWWWLLACGGTPTCVWNQAYQERDSASVDPIDEALAEARDCYVLLDPFDGDEAVQQAIEPLQDAGNEVGCYISVGTCEDWRDDFDELAPHCTETEWDEWAGEYFVSDPDGILPGMEARLDSAASLGCDWVEFDNMDWAFDEEIAASTGHGVSEAAAIAYTNALCEHTRGLGMQCMAKSTLHGAVGFTGGTFESYPDELDWWETADLQGVLDSGGLGIVVHYGASDCAAVEADYRASYGSALSFLCEQDGAYVH